MSLMYSSALEITSIMTCGRNCASIFEIVSSLDAAPPRISAVVITCLTLQASPMMAAAATFSPAVATMTTRSAVLTSSTRSLVRPARSLSQPPIEDGSPRGGAAGDRQGGGETRPLPRHLRQLLDDALALGVERDHLHRARLRIGPIDAEFGLRRRAHPGRFALRRRAQQHLALLERSAHQAEFVVLEIAQAAMDQLRRRRRRGGRQVV